MKEKGFTLIELLAVIVILAIIALIATPVVLNIIKDSKNSSIERSAELYLSQIKNEIARYNMANPSTNFNPTECIVQSDDSLICDGISLNIEINGDKPSAGSKILLSNGSITGLGNFKISGKTLKYIDGKITQSICAAVTTATTGNVPSGSFNIGDEYICDVGDGELKTFFVLETSGDNVSLIMYANVGVDGKAVTSSSTNLSTVAWVSLEDYIAAGGTESDYGSFGNNTKGPLTAAKALKEYTSTWSNLTSSQITLPTDDQLNPSIGKTWLHDYLHDTTHLVSSLYGYWSSTPRNGSTRTAWSVYYKSELKNVDVFHSGIVGVRPVITLSKLDIQ